MQCFNANAFPDCWKRTVIVLLPKKVSPTKASEFRPKSVCTLKICAKILAARIDKVLPKVISWEQGAYVGGRSISDNILLASEAHHTVTEARPVHDFEARHSKGV